jgi:sialidase-1
MPGFLTMLHQRFTTFVIVAVCLFSQFARATEPASTIVFTAGENGYPSIRIPSLLATRRGTLLAFAEGRAAEADQAANQMILKRSTDNGRTWGPLQVIARDGKNSLNNPCAVQDESSGQILMMIQSYPAGGKEFNGRLKPGTYGTIIEKNYLITSDDDGAKWSTMKDITTTTKAADAITIAGGPGIGIQLTRGPNRGRLIMPFNQRVGPFWDVRTVFSDDHGATWGLGDLVPEARAVNAKGRTTSMVNEVQMVELEDGAVRMNSRRADDKPFRKTAVSRDGGQTWSKVEQEEHLPDPTCMGSILRYSFAASGDKSRIIYSGPHGPGRKNGTIRVSYDDGRTWPVSKVLYPGPFAYSCLTRLNDGSIGILYETGKKGAYETLTFSRFSLDWVEQP